MGKNAWIEVTLEMRGTILGQQPERGVVGVAPARSGGRRRLRGREGARGWGTGCFEQLPTARALQIPRRIARPEIRVLVGGGNSGGAEIPAPSRGGNSGLQQGQIFRISEMLRNLRYLAHQARWEANNFRPTTFKPSFW
jgi:hypothetical protein